MSRNADLFAASQAVIPGGVNSPVRAFKSVGGTPVFFARARGAHVWDADGRQYVDYVGSWGPAILGHAHPDVVRAVQAAAENGLSFGAPSEPELTIAHKIRELVPSIEKVRLTSSGTEATMSAIRLARGFTGRSRFIKFEGCYHGHADFLLVKAGSGALTFGNPTSAGVPPAVAAETLVLDYNDVAGLERTFAEIGDEIACVIVEPFAGNMNLVKPTPEFITALVKLTRDHGALLIFDEVMTGFRVARGGAQSVLRVTPDLTTLGKVIGGGMPVGAFGGRADVMDALAPTGPVYQAGTLSGNPVSVAAGLATLDAVSKPGFYEALSEKTLALCDGLNRAANEAGVTFCADCQGGMFGLYFADNPPQTFAEVMASDRERFNRFFHAMLERGFYFAPSAFEAGFVSAAHSEADIAATIDTARAVFKTL